MPYLTGLYSGLNYLFYDLDGSSEQSASQALSDISTFINNRITNNQVDSIVSIFALPTGFIPRSGHPLSDPVSVVKSVNRPTSLDTYNPRNNKLFTYPYLFLCVDTLNDAKNYRYEYSNLFQSGGLPTDKRIDIEMSLSVTPTPELVCAPKGYNASAAYDGNTSAYDMPNMTEAVVLTGYPQCAFAVDSYKAWLAQHASATAISAASSVISGVAGAVMNNPFAAIYGAIGLAQTINTVAVESTKGARGRNTQGGSSTLGGRHLGVYFKQMSVNRYQARIIDDFFDRYGYATEVIKVPNRAVRPCWTYTKTRDASIHGNLPAEAIVELKNIYNKGITFWKNTSDIGNYNQDNRVSVTP